MKTVISATLISAALLAGQADAQLTSPANPHASTCSATAATSAAVPAAPAAPGRDRARGDLVDTALAAGSFNTLAAAVTAAGLVDALRAEGPFTVFAPTDEAFAKLPAGTVESLLKPENRERLVSILTYHVVPGRVPASEVVGLRTAPTLNGQRLDIALMDDAGVMIDGARVVKTDVMASNGIIHVIDTVMLPEDRDVIGVAVEDGRFTTLAAALDAAGLVGALQGSGPFTVLAPTDAAFAKLPAGTVESLLKPENKERLVSILTYHVVPGRIDSTQALDAGSATTLQGKPVRFTERNGTVSVSGAQVLIPDVGASNGTIHVIDTVLIP